MTQITPSTQSDPPTSVSSDPRTFTFARVSLVYTLAGWLAAGALILAEATDHPTRFRVIYSIWATTALLIPTVGFFFFANLRNRARAYWSLFYTSAYAVYLIHFYFAVFVHFGGFQGTIEGQGPVIAWGNFLLTVLWTLDVLVLWTATVKDYRVWNRHMLVLLILVLTFLFFTLVRGEGVIRVLGGGLLVTLIVAPTLRWVYGARLRNETLVIDDTGPQEKYFRGSLRAEIDYFDRFIQQINLVQLRTRKGNYPSPVRRAFHAKRHLGLSNARFEVHPDIPNDLRVSLFAEPKTYSATVRISSASGKEQPDAKKDLRGFALRVHLDDANAHDFMATNAPASHARDAYQFMAVATAASKRFRFLMPVRLMLAVGPFEMVRIFWVVLTSRSRVPSLASETYWSRSPIRVGQTAARYALIPLNTPKGSIRPEQPNYLRDELVRQLQQGDIVFDLVFQRFVDERRTPIEDSSIEWTFTASPPIKMARITIPQQNLNRAAIHAMEATVDQISFNPWRTSEALKPLGSQNRARQLVYKSSADYRRGRKEVETVSWLLRAPVIIMIPLFRFLNRFVAWHRWPFSIIEILNLDTFRPLLRQHNLYDPDPASRLQASTFIKDFDSSKTIDRQSDGTYNDLTDTSMGRAGSVFGRNMPLDSLKTPTAQTVLEPNPRLISRQLHARDTFIPASTLNLIAAAWIQFQVHGWFNHTKLRNVYKTPHFWDVELAPDDPWREYENPMRIPKTPVQGRTRNGIPMFANTETHWWDASQIYGNSKEETTLLRTGQSGYLQMDGDLLPTDPRIPFGEMDLTGFSDNYWLGLSLMHTLFVREHNAICDRLRSEFPNLKNNDEWLFQKARLVNAALMAKIHTVEWTPGILGRKSLQTSMRANWWGLLGEQFKETFGRVSGSEEISGIVGSVANHHAAPYALTEDFVTVYRMHPLIPDDYLVLSLEDTSQTEYTFQEINGLQTRGVMKSTDQANLWYSLGVAHPGAITLKNYPNQLRDLVVHRDRHVDLATIDNLRDRERALPRYNDFRRHLRMKPIKRWKDITANPAVAEEIQDLYGGDLEQVDTMVGLHAETPPEGFGFSDTAFRIFILMASRRLKSDRFYTNDYNVTTYTQPGLNWIRDNLMTDVLLRHFPSLEPTLKGLGNTFAPWNRL